MKLKKSKSLVLLLPAATVLVLSAMLATPWMSTTTITSQAEGAFERGEEGILSACEHGAGNTHMEGRARPLNQTCG